MKILENRNALEDRTRHRGIWFTSLHVYKNYSVVVSLESIITLQIWALGVCLNETEGGLYISPPTDQRHVSRLMDLSHIPLSVSKK